MKRALLLLSAMFIGLGAAGCASHVSYGYVRMAPPPPRHEVIGYAPGPGYVWVGGYYAWRPGAGYYWRRGAWMRPPHKHARWHAGRWEHTRQGFQWRDGYWR